MVSTPSQTDIEASLVERCRLGEEAAWRELVSRHGRRVFAIAYRFVGRSAEAEELAQEIFVRVFRRIGDYREGQGTFSAWLGTLARHQAVDHYRRRRQERLREVGEGEQGLAGFPSPEGGPLRAFESDEAARLVHAGLRALPGELREPLVLCDLRGLAYDEAARLLEIPLGTVKSRVNRARLELARRLLARHGDAIRRS